MSFGLNDITGALSGLPNIRVWGSNGRLKVIGGVTPPPTPVVWGSITGLVTNQTDLINYLDLNFYPLNSNPAGYITSAALTGYVPTTRTLTINGTSYDLSADRSWTIPAGGTVTSVELAAGTGISLSGTNPITTFGTITVTNDAPDQVVVLTAGTGIDITGTYPSFTIENTGLTSAPDLQQVVNAGNGITNFGGTGNASIQSTNFTNNRTLYLNDDAYPTIRLVDNLNAANNLQIDVDTLTIDGVSYNWSSIVDIGFQDVLITDPVLTQDNTIDGAGFTLTFDNNYKFNINAEQLIGLTVNDGAQSVEFNLYPQAGSTAWVYDDGAGNRTAIEMSGVKMYIQTPNYASKTNGDVLTLIDNGSGQVEFQTPGTTTGDSLSPLLLMGG